MHLACNITSKNMGKLTDAIYYGIVLDMSAKGAAINVKTFIFTEVASPESALNNRFASNA